MTIASMYSRVVDLLRDCCMAMPRMMDKGKSCLLCAGTACSARRTTEEVSEKRRNFKRQLRRAAVCMEGIPLRSAIMAETARSAAPVLTTKEET